MKLNNPWIDPRVADVRSQAARTYLAKHGWRAMRKDQARLQAFERRGAAKNSAVVSVPLREQARDYPQRVIELVTDLAVAEGRNARDILNDILQQPEDNSRIAPNGMRAEKQPKERHRTLSNPKITFAQLRQLLLDMGFAETVTPRSHVFFAHEASGAEVALPIYRSNRIVLPHHLITVRIMLDAKGLMDANDFDEFVSSASA